MHRGAPYANSLILQIAPVIFVFAAVLLRDAGTLPTPLDTARRP
ncbi:MAG: hypothetical protein WBW61_09615 [Rhodanobacteraceae bacterium]